MRRKRFVVAMGLENILSGRYLDQKLDWFVLSDGRNDSLEADESRIIRSEVFLGLWLPVSALLDGDMAGVLATVVKQLSEWLATRSRHKCNIFQDDKLPISITSNL